MQMTKGLVITVREIPLCKGDVATCPCLGWLEQKSCVKIKHFCKQFKDLVSTEFVLQI